MKRLLLAFGLLILLGTGAKAQEKYGNTLNLGAGFGYYGFGYDTPTAPALMLNYEFDVFRNFTLAPFIGVATYRDYYYWGGPGYPYRDYSYRETIVPLGVKGCYYFDELFRAGDKWDFYAGMSLGFAFHSVVWENGYYGDRVVRTSSPVFANLHIGTELHLSQKVGMFLDLSTGFSTFGFAFHL